MENDKVLAMLLSTGWFAGGAVLYYIISLHKVYILWFVQPRIANNTEGEEQKPFKHFYPRFFGAIRNRPQIFRFTIRYLFRYKAAEWVMLDDKSVKRRIKWLEGLTKFLKPYLIISFIFIFLNLWIRSHFAYQALSITLGEIQELVNQISQLEWLTAMAEHKSIVLLIYGLLCIIIPFLYERAEQTEKIKNYFRHFLIYLSVFINVSFFATGVGAYLEGQQQELSRLGIEIIKIHEQIYLKANQMIVIKQVADYQKAKETYYKQAADHLDKQITTAAQRTDLDSLLQKKLLESLRHLALQLKTNLISPVADEDIPAFNTNVNDGALYTHQLLENKNDYDPADEVNHFYQEKVKPEKPNAVYEAYFENKSTWNKQEGTRILDELKAIDAAANKKASPFMDKLKRFADTFISFGLELATDKGFSLSKSDVAEPIKSFIGWIMDEGLKDCLVDGTVNLLTAVKQHAKATKEMLRTACSSKQKNEFVPGNIQQTDDQFVQNQIADADRQQAEINKKGQVARAKQEREERLYQAYEHQVDQIAEKIRTEIESKPLDAPTPDQVYQYLKKKHATSEFLETVRERYGDNYGFTYGSQLKQTLQTIISQQNSDTRNLIATRLESYLVPGIGNMTQDQYLKTLEGNYRFIRQQRTVGSAFKTIRDQNNWSYSEFSLNFGGICPCCGLPLSFPVCGCKVAAAL
jgi:hypothetical protein